MEEGAGSMGHENWKETDSGVKKWHGCESHHIAKRVNSLEKSEQHKGERGYPDTGPGGYSYWKKEGKWEAASHKLLKIHTFTEEWSGGMTTKE